MSTIPENVQLLEEQLHQASDPVVNVDLLNAQAYALRHSNPSLSMQKCRQAKTQAEEISYQKGVATAMLNQGFGEMVQAEYNVAFQTLYVAAGIFQSLPDKPGHAHALYNIGVVYSRIGEYSQALDFFQQSLAIRQEISDRDGEASCLMQLAYIHERFGNDAEAADYYQRCLALRRQSGDEAGIGAALLGIGIIEQKKGRYAAAEDYLQQSLEIRSKIGEIHGWLVSMNYLGEFYLSQNKTAEAENCLAEAIEKAAEQEVPFPANLCRLYTSMARVQMRHEQSDKAIYYLEKALQTATKSNLKYLLYDIYLTLSEVYQQKGDYRQALVYHQHYHRSKEEVINLSASARLKNLELANQIEAEKKEAEIHRLRHIELKKAYDQLQQAQEQLIQAEKLAYLGHLMTGIAHEIQNPLNFVNNFSEINMELLEEWKELKTGRIQEEMPREQLREAIGQNMAKILSHGRRADAIVKSMLLHARVGSSQKKPFDLNELVSENLRLCIEGMKAKESSFAVTVKTSLAEDAGTVNMVAPDISRVLLNLFNNAFYAMQQKKEQTPGPYEPVLLVQTNRVAGKVEIVVTDNGTGIPQAVVDKIYQPFFTTKPTGEGTGLGLSLSYDIIVKGHSGELAVRTEEGSFTTFTVTLPG